MREARFPCLRARALLALLLCVVLFTGCAGVRPDVGAGVFGPSWQAREAAYLQEAEEDDEFGERMEAADRKSNTKKVLAYLAVGAILAWALTQDEDESQTFENPLEFASQPQRPGAMSRSAENRGNAQ